MVIKRDRRVKEIQSERLQEILCREKINAEWSLYENKGNEKDTKMEMKKIKVLTFYFFMNHKIRLDEIKLFFLGRITECFDGHIKLITLRLSTLSERKVRSLPTKWKYYLYKNKQV